MTSLDDLPEKVKDHIRDLSRKAQEEEWKEWKCHQTEEWKEAGEIAQKRQEKIIAKANAYHDNQPDPYLKWLKEHNQTFSDAENNIGKKLSYKMAEHYNTKLKQCHNNTTGIILRSIDSQRPELGIRVEAIDSENHDGVDQPVRNHPPDGFDAKTGLDNIEVLKYDINNLKFFMGFYMTTDLVPMSHSWFVTETGLLLDPTLAIPSEILIKKDGSATYNFEGLTMKDSQIYSNRNARYVGVEIPRDIMVEIFIRKQALQNQYGVFQHRWLQEFYLISELGYSVDEVVLHTGFGEEGNDSWQTMFEMLIDAKT